jgi:hypothetical protein
VPLRDIVDVVLSEVDSKIVWMKLGALTEGAGRATRELW